MARKSRKALVGPDAGTPEEGLQAQPPGVVEFSVAGPLPRYAPYKKYRYRLYVPADVRAWRGRLAKAFLSAGGRAPNSSEQLWWSAAYSMVKSHADLDSLSHSLQDALSKDALHVVDKEWHIAGITHAHVERKRQEAVVVRVEYKERNGR